MPNEPVRIKKVKKKVDHSHHHGGEWKVAYADFVTALMALFLVLWLVAVMSIDSKKAVAEYFRSFSVLQGDQAGGGAGIGILQGTPIQLDPDVGDMDKGDSYKKLELQLVSLVEEELESVNDQVLIFVTKEGVRIELVEKYGKPMFERGTAKILQEGYDMIGILSLALRDADADIAIEGHSDALGVQSGDYSNWELSSDRANSARRALEETGFPANKIAKVTGYGDKVPLYAADPKDPRNRRVSILVMPK